MNTNDNTDEVYAQFIKTKKKKKIRSIIVGVIILIFILAFAALIWIANNLETFDKMIGKAKKDKKPVEYSEIAFTTNDMASMEFALNGKVVTFPLSVKELEQTGYTLTDDGLIQGKSDLFYTVRNCSAEANDFDSHVSLSVANLNETDSFARDCVIQSIFAKDEHFILCNGISLSSTYDEVVAVMGKPDKLEDTGYSKTLEYFYDTPSGEMEVYINFSSGSGAEQMKTLMLFDKSY